MTFSSRLAQVRRGRVDVAFPRHPNRLLRKVLLLVFEGGFGGVLWVVLLFGPFKRLWGTL